MYDQNYLDRSKQIDTGSLQKVCLPFLKPTTAYELVLMMIPVYLSFNTINVACAPTLISVYRDKCFAAFFMSKSGMIFLLLLNEENSRMNKI